MSSRSVIAKRTAASVATKPSVPGSIGSVANANVRRPPYASIQSQVAFSQAQQAQQAPSPNFNLQQQQQLNQPPRKVGLQKPTQQIAPQLSQSQFQSYAQPQSQQSQQSQSQNQIPTKLNLNVAFGLTTLRLCKLEEQIMDINQHMQELYEKELETGTVENGKSGILSLEEREQYVHKDVYEGLTKKVEFMEKMIKDTNLNIQKILKENQQMKQNLITVTNHLNKHITDTTNKFIKTDNSLYQLDTNIQSLQYIEQEPQQSEFVEDHEYVLDNFNGEKQPTLMENSIHDPSLFTQTNPIHDTTSFPPFSNNNENIQYSFSDSNNTELQTTFLDNTSATSTTSLLEEDNINESNFTPSILHETNDKKKSNESKKRPPSLVPSLVPSRSEGTQERMQPHTIQL